MAKASLCQRLYAEPPLYELARLVGYAGLAVPDAQERLKALTDKYGKEAMAQAAEEIVSIDTSSTPPTVRLKDNVRKLCFQLMGPAPESPAFERVNGTAAGNDSPQPTREKRPRRRR